MAGVTPGGEYKIADIHNAVHQKLNRIPSIHCYSSPKDGKNYLSEIRLCFSKSLELINCHVTGNAEMVYRSAATNVEVLTNCNLHKEIIYADSLPQIDFATNSNNSWLHKFIDLFKQSLV